MSPRGRLVQSARGSPAERRRDPHPPSTHPAGTGELDASSIFSPSRSGSAGPVRPSAVAAAAALGIGPGMAHAFPPVAPRQRILLQNMQVPSRRKPNEEAKEPSTVRRSPSPRRNPSHPVGSGVTTGGGGGDDDGPSGGKISTLRLPMLRSVFQQAPGSMDPKSRRTTTPATSAETALVVAAEADASETAIVGGPDADYDNYERSLGLCTGEDAIEFFARNGNNTPVKFVYCNRASTAKDAYRPYDLVVVPRKQVSHDEYFTISTTGVVHVASPHPSELMSLAQWMHEAARFNMLRCIRFFKHYLGAKMFRLWRANVRYRIYGKQRKALSKKLFLARDSFAQPLLEVNKIMCEFDTISVSNVKPGVYQAENFVKDQVDARTQASKRFEEKFERLSDQIERVCKGVKDRARQYDHRIANDDLTNSRFAQHLLGGNGRIKSMVSIKKERADRLRQLKHANLEADMLGDFIRLVDYIEVEHLVTRSVSTTVQFLYMLLNSNKALFQTTVAFAPDHGHHLLGAHHGHGRGHGGGNANGLNFSPTAREIHAIVASMNESTITTVDTVDRILHHPKFKPFVSPLLTDSPKISRIIHHDRVYNLSKASIADKIDADFSTVELTISFLERHRPVYAYGEQWNLEAYCAGREHTVDSLQKDMLQQTEWNTNIRKVRDLYDAGIFEANTKDLKNKLMPITEVALAGMKGLLLKIFHTKCLELQELYQQRIKQLDEDPSSLPAFATHVETFALIRTEGAALYDRSKKIESMHRLMVEYEMQSLIPPQDEVAFDDLLSSVKAFDHQIGTTDARIEEKIPSMKQTVYKNIARLNNELEAQKALIDEGIFVDEKANPKDVLKELDRVKQTLADIKSQTVTLQGYQVLFEKNDPYHFNALPLTTAVYEKKRAFWELYQSWLDRAKKWNNDDFLTLNVEEIDRDVNETYTTCARINTEARDSPVTLKVKDMVAEFRALMPMVLELGNRAMKTTHWRQLFTNLGASYFPQSEKIRLKNLRKMNMFAHRQLITDICQQAVGEHALAASLAAIQKTWLTAEFPVVPYSETQKDVFILGDLTEVRGSLRETLDTLGAMSASPCLAAVAQEVDLWEKKCAFLGEVLEEWMACQVAWGALAPTFANGDIQRQLPLESRMFTDVDRFWKEVMRRVANNPNVMATTNQPQLLAHFLKANKELERVAKHLEEHEQKRAAFEADD